jgi:transposase
VCNPRKNALLKQGNKSDRIDARKLAELLRGNYLKSVYHGETGVRTLRELARSYLTTTKDLTRVMSRLKALYRSWAIPCPGRDVYYTRHRSQWLAKIPHVGVCRRAEHLYQQLDIMKRLRQQARRELLAESRKYQVTSQLRQIPYVGRVERQRSLAWRRSSAQLPRHRAGTNRFESEEREGGRQSSWARQLGASLGRHLLIGRP